MAKRRHYSDKFKAGAIVMLQSEGYPDDARAVARVASKLDVPGRTLRRWFKGEYGTPPDEIVQDSKKELSDLFESEIRAIMDALPSAREDASYRDLVTGAAILTDKRELLRGKPTDRMQVLDDLSDDERAARVAALLDRARARRDGPPDRSD